jgi:hypothetical protein
MMRNWISAKLAGNTLLISLILLSIFHILVLTGIVPSNIVWGGGSSNSASNIIALELIAFLVTLVFILIVALKAGYLKIGKLKKVATIGIWIMGVFFLLNMVGNFNSSSSVEKLVFGPLTIIMALLAFRLALEK